MATIVLQVNGTAVGNMSVTVELGPESSDRLMAYLQRSFGTIKGKPATPEQMVEAYWATLVQVTAQNVQNSERTAAIKNAESGIKPFLV